MEKHFSVWLYNQLQERWQELLEYRVSVIIPVFNAEKYLNKSVQSVLGQSLKDIEIVLVDDGSTDCSGSLCDKYSEIHENIKVIHQKNSGPATARNIGIENSTADWIMFLDSDDYLDIDAIEKAYSFVDDDIDIVALAFYYDELVPFSADDEEVRIYNIRDNLRNLAIKCRMNGLDYIDDNFKCDLRLTSQCAKLYRKSVIDENYIRFQDGIKDNEDGFFNLEFLLSARTLVFYNHRIYHCTVRSDSLSRSYTHRENEIIKSIEKYHELIRLHDIEDIMGDFLLVNDIIKANQIIEVIYYQIKKKDLSFSQGMQIINIIFKNENLNYSVKMCNYNMMKSTKQRVILCFLKWKCYLGIVVLASISSRINH